MSIMIALLQRSCVLCWTHPALVGTALPIHRNLESLYVDGRGLSLLWVALFVKRHLLSFIQAAQTSTLDGAYVNENVGATTVRLNKPETLCRVEPLHGAVRHLSLQL